MKNLISIAVLVTVLWFAPMQSYAESRAITYKNCTELNKVYKGGVARVGATNVGGKTNYKPFYNNDLYKANSGSDRDKDGIACER